MHSAAVMPSTVVTREHKAFSYSAEHPPAATVAPGERFVVETTSAFGEFPLGPGDTLAGLERGRCDPLTGPIAIEGAEPGDVLEVSVEAIEVQGKGAQGILPGGGILDWPSLPLMFHAVSGDEVLFPGLRLTLAPMIGCIGVAPLDGAIESVLPGDHGGNMDTRYVCPGSVIELPVHHAGALLFLGDCHQLQGDGELCGVAPETDAVLTLRCQVRRGSSIRRPRIRTAERLYFVASAETLELAGELATGDLVDALVADKGLDADVAYFLVTVKADLEVCQVVNDLRTVRVGIDRSLWDQLGAATGP